MRDYLPPEIWEHRERFFFEGMRLEVGPCFRDYSPARRERLDDDDPDLQRYWVDLQTLQLLYYVAYDRKRELTDVGYFAGRWSEDRDDYPSWPEDPERPVRVIDSVGAAFANLRLKVSWRRESWDVVSVPLPDKQVRRSLSIRNLQKGR